MNRGYIKFWRKAEDSVSWTRGLAHRGMMVTILDRAAWQPRFELGIKVQPGEFLVKVIAWAETLGMSQTSVRRILKNLADDGFISITNVANRYTKIIVLNWHIYQQDESHARRTYGEQTANQRLTNGEQAANPSYKEEEVKKERREDKEPPIAPQGGQYGDVPAGFAQFWQAYPKKTGKDAALRAWKKAKGKPDIAAILAVVAKQKTWPQWQRDGGQYIPNPATWLNQGRWNDEPPEVQARDGPSVLRANTVAQQQIADRDMMAQMVLAHRQEGKNDGNSRQDEHACGSSGAVVSALPANRVYPGTAQRLG